jgi:phosphoenolpyruvate carboxykinase (ATP)
MSLNITRKIIDAVHDGSLDNATFENLEVFNLKIPTNIKGVPPQILNPKV